MTLIYFLGWLAWVIGILMMLVGIALRGGGFAVSIALTGLFLSCAGATLLERGAW